MKPPPRMKLTLNPPQWVWLRAEAKRLGISLPELVRRIIDAHREGKAA